MLRIPPTARSLGLGRKFIATVVVVSADGRSVSLSDLFFVSVLGF